MSPWYWAVAGVAAGIALMFMILPKDIPHSTGNLTNVHESSTYVEPEPSATSEMPSGSSEGVDYENNPQSHPTVTQMSVGSFAQKSTTKENNIHSTISKTTLSESKTETLLTSNDSENEQISENQATENETKEAVTPKEAEQKIEKIDKLPDLNEDPEIPILPQNKRKKRPLLLAASLGSGGNSVNQERKQPPQNSFTVPSRQLVNKDISENYLGILNAEDYSDAVHLPPLSFGIMAEVPLTDRVGLESGLVYTYLHSKLRRPGRVDYYGNLQMHYIGIPLKLRTKAFDWTNWNLYFSLGGMVEKGIRSYYNQEIEYPAMVDNKVVKSTIDGFQWTLSSAIGAEYTRTHTLRLCLDPPVVYYLENNQPMSARTEQPLTIGVNGGVRIGL